MADGVYTNAGSPGYVVTVGVNNGSGAINYLGNVANPAAVSLVCNAGPAVAVGGAGASISLNGFKLSSTASAPGFIGSGVAIYGGGFVSLLAIEFGACVDNHISMEGGGASCAYIGPFKISGGCGNAHILALQGAYIRQPLVPPTLTISAPVNIGTFVSVQSAQSLVTYSSITGFANVTGQKYSAILNGVILTSGSGVNYYPGTVAGVTGSGGQYA